MKITEENLEIDLFQMLSALLRRLWLIILTAIIGGALAFGYVQYRVTPLYQSSVLLYVNTSTISVGRTAISMSDLDLSKSLVDTYIVILKTRLTLNEVIARAGLNYSYGTLSSMISASAVNETEVFRVTVTGPDPEEATRIANTIGEVLPQKVAEIIDGTSVRIVDYAVVPGGKASPNVTRYTTMGALVGAVLCGGIIVLLELFDEQIRDEEFLTKTYNLSVLAVVPDLMDNKSKKGYGAYRSYYEASRRDDKT